MTMTRRTALASLTLATSAVAVPATVLALPIPASRAAWSRAVAKLAEAKAHMERASRAHDAAEEACAAACPPREDFWKRYGMGFLRDPAKRRQNNYDCAYRSLMVERAVAAPKRDWTLAEIDALEDRARRLARDFEAHHETREAASKRFRCDELEKAWEAALEVHWNAQRTLLATDAPDSAALLFKLRLFAEMYQGDQAADDLEPVVEDAARLFQSSGATR